MARDASLSNRSEAIELVEAGHRGPAMVELVIRDVKDQDVRALPLRR